MSLDSGILKKDDHRRLEASENVMRLVIELAKKLKAECPFSTHGLYDGYGSPTLRATYELAVGGDAFTSGLPGKTPLNMYLGWYIKNAVAAEVQMVNGKRARASVRNAPVQSYTLLRDAKALSETLRLSSEMDGGRPSALWPSTIAGPRGPSQDVACGAENCRSTFEAHFAKVGIRQNDPDGKLLTFAALGRKG